MKILHYYLLSFSSLENILRSQFCKFLLSQSAVRSLVLIAILRYCTEKQVCGSKLGLHVRLRFALVLIPHPICTPKLRAYALGEWDRSELGPCGFYLIKGPSCPRCFNYVLQTCSANATVNQQCQLAMPEAERMPLPRNLSNVVKSWCFMWNNKFHFSVRVGARWFVYRWVLPYGLGFAANEHKGSICLYIQLSELIL